MRHYHSSFIVRSLCALAALGTLALAPAASAVEPTREWTFLLFLNGHNNLDEFGDLNINQMERVGSNDQVNLIVQWASLRAKSTVRLHIQKDADDKKITSPVVDDLKKPADMGDAATLEEFIRWGTEAYPAKHYFVAVWNHGGGWHLQQQVRNKLNPGKHSPRGTLVPQDISWDDRTGHHITTEEMGQVMARSAERLGRKFDIFGTDACLMAMAEVAGELAPGVQYFVGSEEVEPGAGWAYDDFLNRWYAEPQASAKDVARFLVESYVASYQGGQNGREDVTLSAMDLDALPKLASATAALAKKLKKITAKQADAVLEAAKATQSFTYSDYLDMGHFADLLAKKKLPGYSAPLAALQAAIAEFAYSNGVTSGYQTSKGISFWLPQNTYSYNAYAKRFAELKWNQATQWDSALAKLMGFWKSHEGGSDDGGGWGEQR